MKTENPKESIYRVQALERAMDILDCFSFQNRERTLSDIVKKTGLNKTTVIRLISNLITRGYIQQDHISKKYQLGLRLFELGGIVSSSFSLRKSTAHPMNRLQEQTGATVLLGVMMEDQLVYMDRREGDGLIRVSSDIGWRRPLHFGMLGTILMAYLEADKIDDILARYPLEAYTPLSITDPEKFILRLKQIHKQGYFMETDEAVEGTLGIAAPIRDHKGNIIAALGIVFTLGQQKKDMDTGRYVDLVKKTTEGISVDLGYNKKKV